MHLKSQTRIFEKERKKLWLFKDIHYCIQRAAQMGTEFWKLLPQAFCSDGCSCTERQKYHKKQYCC